MWRKWASIVIFYLQIVQCRVTQTFILKNIVAYSRCYCMYRARARQTESKQNKTHCSSVVNDMSFKWTTV